MAPDRIPGLPVNVARPDTIARPDAERQTIKLLAQEFEALLMTQMLREMRRSMLDEEDQPRGFGAGALNDTLDVELGRSLSRVGGLGLSDALLGAFNKLAGVRGASANPRVATEHDSKTVDPTLAQDSVLPVPNEAGGLDVTADPALVTSAFGWRSDPRTGAPRFHRGIDLAIAYGQDVRAAAPGRVAFAGTERGYGNTVVIEHGGGRQTRYAHLSQQLVREGDQVTGGQVLGKSGSSGRSTGPHLHFEMLVNGRPTDPRKP